MPTVDEQGQQRYFQRVITPRPPGVWLRPSPPGGHCFAIGAPTGHSQPPHQWSRTGTSGGQTGWSLPPPRQVRRQAIPRRVLGFGRTVRPRPSKHSE